MSATKRTWARRTAVAAGLGAALLGLWSMGCGGPPQMGADEQVFAAVDALFTAITARDERLLGRCEQRLHGLRAAGKLPAGAADFLDGVIARARNGRWASAAEKLYGFMKGQRREGAPGQVAPKARPTRRARGKIARAPIHPPEGEHGRCDRPAACVSC